jgi:hypothetical protein
VKGFSQLVAPLTNLTKKGVFQRLEYTHVAFDKMKKVMSTCLVLALPYFTQPFVLECDASDEGIGEVLMHNQHLIDFERRKLRDPENLYPIL